MIRSRWVVVGAGVASVGFAAANCTPTVQNTSGSTATGSGTSASTSTSSGTTSGTTTSTGAGGAGGSAAMHAEPPPAGPTKPGDGTGSVTFAISKLYLGDTDPDGTPDMANGWKFYGFDLDGKISTATSTDLCKPAENASPKTVYPDGNDGIDNSFGKLILPIVLGISADASTKINAAISGGSSTVMFDMQKLGSGADYNPLVTNVFDGGKLGAAPKFDGSDMWPVLSTSLNDGMTIASGAKVSLPASYVTGNTWVSKDAGTVDLRLELSGSTMDLVITNTVITLGLDPTHKHGTKGIIGGVLNTAQLGSEFRKLAGSFDTSLCSGATIDSIITQITQASDIMQDGTQDPTKTCDGISIGLGFDAELVQLGPVVVPPVTSDPCAMSTSSSSTGGGTGGSGGG